MSEVKMYPSNVKRDLRMSQLVHGGFGDVNVVKLVDGQSVRGGSADCSQIRVS